jgi:hypothetical protein
MENKKSIFDKLEGVKPIDAATMEGFKREMTENVIPEIARVVEERRLLAHESRHRRIEALAAPEKKSE